MISNTLRSSSSVVVRRYITTTNVMKPLMIRCTSSVSSAVKKQQLHHPVVDSYHQHQTFATVLLNSLSFASPEESEASYIQSMLPKNYNHHCNISHIPRTLQDVLQSKHACIVTSLNEPHSIIAVNDAWTQLCGYTQAEVHHQSIASILHGPQTNIHHIQNTMKRVMTNIVPQQQQHNHHHNDIQSLNTTEPNMEDMYVVNYKKDGTKFINHVMISKIILSHDQSDQQYLLGILQPVTSVPLRMMV